MITAWSSSPNMMSNCQTEQSYHHGQILAEQPMVDTKSANACATGK